MRQDKGEVARHRIFQGGYGRGFFQTRDVRPPALQQVSQTLHHNSPARQHVSKLGNIAAVFDRLVKRLGKLGGNQHGKIGVLRPLILIRIGMAIDDRDPAVLVLLADNPAGIHAESAHLVFKRI